jgi:hypothetical protein
LLLGLKQEPPQPTATKKEVVMKTKIASLLAFAFVVFSAGLLPAAAQDDEGPTEAQTLTIPLQGETPEQAMQDSLTGSTVPLWPYWSFSNVDYKYYTGYIMGGAPGFGVGVGKGTTNIPTYIIPLILKIGRYTFDPTKADACSRTGAPLTIVQKSPLFNDAPMVWGGTNLGTTQYIDASLRAEFWTALQGLPLPWHTKFKVATLNAITVVVPPAYGTTYRAPCGRLGVVSQAWMDALVKTLIPQLRTKGVGPTSFPLFLVYNVAQTAPGFLLLGYHSAYGPPLQVYSVAAFDTTGKFQGSQDISILSHELAEATNDPTGKNYTPSWGHVGQVQGCQNNFEVGDPLTGKLNPAINLNGYTYHPQELAFFAWFYRINNYGVNGWYSTNGTFQQNAGGLCF